MAKKAKDISGQAPGGKRTRLAEALPLSTPFVIQMFPIYNCNFKCSYCGIFRIEKDKRGFISDKIVMDFDLYKKCINDMADFPEKIKVLRFVGIGEPLLHPQIADMVKYASQKGVAKTIEILTNGSLLIPKMADALIAAGLSRLVVSLQGTSKEKYQKISKANLDFENFVNNLRYFFVNKGLAKMYIKIIDCALDGEDDKKRFYEIFGNISDTIAVEHTVPIHSGVDYENILKGKKMGFTQFGLPVSEVKICPQPFFHMQINPDGKVVPCYSFEYPAILGDCNKQSVKEIWNNSEFQTFRHKMLGGIKGASKICGKCELIKYRLFPEDVLNNDAERLKKYYV
ncbi:MAG: radical SAM protein [Patescibacteria group bacterium]